MYQSLAVDLAVMEETTLKAQFIRFLQEEMGIPVADLTVGQRLLNRATAQRLEQNLNLLPIILWQYGLVTLVQLDQVFDWLAEAEALQYSRSASAKVNAPN